MTLEERALEVGTSIYGETYDQASAHGDQATPGYCPRCQAYSPAVLSAFVSRNTKHGRVGAFVYFCKDVDTCRLREAVRSAH